MTAFPRSLKPDYTRTDHEHLQSPRTRSDEVKVFAKASIRDGGKMTMMKEQIDAACGEAKPLACGSPYTRRLQKGARASIGLQEHMR